MRQKVKRIGIPPEGRPRIGGVPRRRQIVTDNESTFSKKCRFAPWVSKTIPAFHEPFDESVNRTAEP
jgi:hypothetical protein